MTLPHVETAPLGARAPVLDPLSALPPEWDDWAEEPAHQVVVEEEGAAVGAIHFALVSATEAWLEGIRVRSDRQGRGIGRRLVEEGEALARRYGAGIVRTAIPAHHYAGQAVAERAGYRTSARALVLESQISAGPIDVPYDAQLREARSGEAGPVVSRLTQSPILEPWHGLVPLGWRFRTLLPLLVKGLVKDRRVLRTGERVEGAALFALHQDAAVIGALAGEPSHLQALVGGIAERARGRGITRLVFVVPDDRALRGVRGERRPHPWCPDGLIIVEKEIG